MSPVELIKVAQQCAGGLTATAAADTASTSVSVQRVVRSIGSRSLATPAWRCGLNATLLRDGIPHGVWFVTYEISKDFMLSSKSLSLTAAETNPSEIVAVDEAIPVVVPLVSGKQDNSCGGADTYNEITSPVLYAFQVRWQLL